MRIERHLDALARRAIQDALGVEAEPALRPTQDPKHGDYQINGLLGLKAKLGKPPREIAAPVAARMLEAAEIAEAEERERIRKENERLRAERAELEKQQAEERARMEAERRKAEEQAQKERAERERLEAEARKKEEEEKARKAAENEARRRAAAAPDKEKLMAFAAELSAIEVPAVEDKQARRIREELENRMSAIAKWLREEAERL